MAKHLLDLKLEVAKIVLAGPDGHKRVAARYGLSPSMVRRWTAAYKAHGLAGLKKPYALYPIDIRYQAVQSVLTDGLSIYEAMNKYNIPTHTTLQNWIRLYNEGGIEAVTRGVKLSQFARSKTEPLFRKVGSFCARSECYTRKSGWKFMFSRPRGSLSDR